MSDLQIVQTLSTSNTGDITRALSTVAADDRKTIAYLGVIVGKANGVSYRSNKFDPGNPAIAMTGIFEATPYNTEDAIVRASSLFLPGAIQSILVKTLIGDAKSPVSKPLKLGQKIDVEAGKELLIKLEVGVKRNDNAEGVGYEYIINMVGDPERVEALESVKAEFAKSDNPRIKAMMAGQPQLSAPVKSAAIAAPKKTVKKK